MTKSEERQVNIIEKDDDEQPRWERRQNTGQEYL